MARGQTPTVKQVVAELRNLFRGVVKQHDPGALLAGELQDAQNARIVNGILQARGGQSSAGVGKVGGLTGTPLAVFDDWEGDIPVYPTYGAFLWLAGWGSPFAQPPYRAVLTDLNGASITSTSLGFSAGIAALADYFDPTYLTPIEVGDYLYTVFQQIGGTTYGGVGWRRQFFLARMPKDGTGPYDVYDTYLAARLQVAQTSPEWGGFHGLCHDGDNFIVAFPGIDNGGGGILTGTYETQVLRLASDLASAPVSMGSYITDINSAITSLGGTAINGTTGQRVGIAYANGYYLLYPKVGTATEMTSVGGARPGYGAYLIKGAVTGWQLVNATATLEDDALGRCCPHITHDGKVYLMTADSALSGPCHLKVWDPGTDPSVVTTLKTLASPRQWVSSEGPNYSGGRGFSWNGKLYMSWRNASAGTIGIASYDPATGTFVDEVTSAVIGTTTSAILHLVQLRQGLALIVSGVSGSQGFLNIHYATDETLTTWVTTTTGAPGLNYSTTNRIVAGTIL